MAKDRNGNRLQAGDEIVLIPGMRVDGYDRGRIDKIDGEYIMVYTIVGQTEILVERYGCELWLASVAEKDRR